MCEIKECDTKGFILLTLLGSVLASFSYLIYLYNPLEVIIEKLISFNSNSIIFGLWKEPPYEVLIKIYIFNVTNPNEFLDGTEKLNLKEVGPYAYKEELYHENIIFNDNGTMSFTPKRRLKFMLEHSIGNSSNDLLLFPNIPLLGISASLVDESMIYQIGISSISAYLGSQEFINLTVSDFLYGYDDPLVTLANDYLPNWIDFPRFGILDRIMNLDNDSSVVTMNINPEKKTPDNTVLTETKQIEQFSIQSWDGSFGLKQWGYEEPAVNESVEEQSKCNLVQGCFMGTLFPRDIKENSSFYLYRRAFCRPIPIIYDKSVVTKSGFNGYLFKVKKHFLEHGEDNPENKCYCESDCLPKGLGNISPCYYGIPISLSQPHFLNGDQSLLESVDGLSPNKEKHDFLITIDPKLGVPLEANLRIQINLVMPTTRYNSKTKPFNDLVIPLFWIDLSIEKAPKIVEIAITALYYVLPVVQQVIMLLFAIAGLILVVGSSLVFVIYNRPSSRHKSFHVNYTQIPIFPLKTKLFKPDVLIQK